MLQGIGNPAALFTLEYMTMAHILINRCYSEITPESVRDGEFSDCGGIEENEPVSFRDLVCLMKQHQLPSSWPTTGERSEWYSSEYEVIDYHTMTQQSTTIHFSRSNPDRMAKYWKFAAKFAGIVK